MKIEKFGDLILKANEPKLLLFNLYDDWLKSVGANTAFARMIMIMRAININKEKTNLILRPNKDVITQPNHIWPNLSDDQWLQVEIGLRDLILADYAKKNNANIAALTETELRDIILGMEMTEDSIRNKAIEDIDKQRAEAAKIT